MIPGPGIGAFPLDNLLINIDGGDPQSSDALVIANSFGTTPAVLPATEFVVLDRGRDSQLGHGSRLLGRNDAVPGHQL